MMRLSTIVGVQRREEGLAGPSRIQRSNVSPWPRPHSNSRTPLTPHSAMYSFPRGTKKQPQLCTFPAHIGTQLVFRFMSDLTASLSPPHLPLSQPCILPIHLTMEGGRLSPIMPFEVCSSVHESRSAASSRLHLYDGSRICDECNRPIIKTVCLSPF
jgi:hypothetical protein